jgi:hypothetical protein
MARQRFNRAVTAVVDASGCAECQITPPGMDWTIETTTVSVSSNVLEPECRTYLNGYGEPNLVEGTYSGSRDTSDTTHYLQAGDFLAAVWTGADVGAVATLRVSGWQSISGEGG